MTVLLITAGSIFCAAVLQSQQQALAGKLVRLHIVGHSDAPKDQSEKLLVRDAVLAVTEPLAETADNPRMALAEALPEIKSAAEHCLKLLGSDHTVSVSLEKERFPTRRYENFALPAGVYPSLRVTIGAGEGKNWWCVAFPSVCFCATSDELETAAVFAGFTENEIRLIMEDGDKYILKFKIIELLGELKERLFA